MDLSALVPLIVIFVMISIFLSMMAMVGLNPMALVWLIVQSRRTRTQTEPRDHFDRWDYGHRRSSYNNKPRRLRWAKTTGDRIVPEVRVGRAWGIEPWRNYYILYVKSRRLSWSAPYIIPQALCSDLNRRVLWIRAAGFSKVGPVNIPIPIEGETTRKFIGRRPDGKMVYKRIKLTTNALVEDVLEGFRFSMDQQQYMDITEDLNWNIGAGMAPPISKQTEITNADNPTFRETEYLPEENATGGPTA